MFRYLILIMALVAVSSNSQAKKFSYGAEVDGMVCAFCVYNVSKNISSLPGVDNNIN